MEIKLPGIPSRQHQPTALPTLWGSWGTKGLVWAAPSASTDSSCPLCTGVQSPPASRGQGTLPLLTHADVHSFSLCRLACCTASPRHTQPSPPRSPAAHPTRLWQAGLTPGRHGTAAEGSTGGRRRLPSAHLLGQGWEREMGCPGQRQAVRTPLGQEGTTGCGSPTNPTATSGKDA